MKLYISGYSDIYSKLKEILWVFFIKKSQTLFDQKYLRYFDMPTQCFFLYFLFKVFCTYSILIEKISSDSLLSLRVPAIKVGAFVRERNNLVYNVSARQFCLHANTQNIHHSNPIKKIASRLLAGRRGTASDSWPHRSL